MKGKNHPCLISRINHSIAEMFSSDWIIQLRGDNVSVKYLFKYFAYPLLSRS
jgi:hypothetical protein